MYRIGDKVKVINACAYHNWNAGTIAEVHHVGDDSLRLRTEVENNGSFHQTLYLQDVEFVSRTDYRAGDKATVIGHSYSHNIPIGAIVRVERVRNPVGNQVIDVVYEETSPIHRQGVAPESLAPIEFTASQGFARLVMNDSSIAYRPEPADYARAVPNDVVKVNIITDRPRCEDDGLFTEFTSWQRFGYMERGVSDGLVIDRNAVITFLGTDKAEEYDLFSIRYEDTGNIVIAKGKLNNGYAKYIQEND